MSLKKKVTMTQWLSLTPTQRKAVRKPRTNNEVIPFVARLRAPGKLCAMCDIIHPLEEFYKVLKSKSGYSWQCKRCEKACAIKRWKGPRRAKELARRRELRKLNRDAINLKQKEYYQANKERIRLKYRKMDRQKRLEGKDSHRKWYRHSMKGFVYFQARFIREGYGLIVEKEALRQWLYRQPNFKALHTAWKDSNFAHTMRPTVMAKSAEDRKNRTLKSLKDACVVTVREKISIIAREKDHGSMKSGWIRKDGKFAGRIKQENVCENG